MSAWRYWLKSPKGFWKYSFLTYGEKEYREEFDKRLRATEALNAEQRKHEITKNKLIEVSKDLLQLKRREKSLGR